MENESSEAIDFWDDWRDQPENIRSAVKTHLEHFWSGEIYEPTLYFVALARILHGFPARECKQRCREILVRHVDEIHVGTLCAWAGHVAGQCEALAYCMELDNDAATSLVVMRDDLQSIETVLSIVEMDVPHLRTKQLGKSARRVRLFADEADKSVIRVGGEAAVHKHLRAASIPDWLVDLSKWQSNGDCWWIRAVVLAVAKM